MRALLLLLCSCLLLGVAVGADLDDADLDARIDRVRKVDAVVVLRGADGKPVSGQVSYRLTRNAFRLGTCVAGWISFPDPDADRLRYREVLARWFNSAVAENAMKWQYMEEKPGVLTDEIALGLWRWCHEKGLEVRGHCVFWGTNQGPMAWTRALDKAELEAAMRRRAQHLLTLFKGKVREWDVNNEMLHGDVYAKKLGLPNGAEYFRWCRAVDPDVRLYVNDYEILGGNRVDAYVAQIKELIAAGADVGGIGDQAHLRGGVPSNRHVWEILDKLGQFKVPVTITEFDLDTKDEAKQAADTRRFYRLCAAHPAVDGVFMWGFWEGRHWRPHAAMYRKDWSLKPNGEAYQRLFDHDFMTSGTATADAGGAVGFRGFRGDYRLDAGGAAFTVKVTSDGEVVAQPAAR